MPIPSPIGSKLYPQERIFSNSRQIMLSPLPSTFYSFLSKNQSNTSVIALWFIWYYIFPCIYRRGVRISEPLSIILACSSGYAINTRCVETCYRFFGVKPMLEKLIDKHVYLEIKMDVLKVQMPPDSAWLLNNGWKCQHSLPI